MHATLLSTSSHALAVQHLTRMNSLPALGESPSHAEAQIQLHNAELELGERMKELHGSFMELMRRTHPPPAVAQLGSPPRRRSEVTVSGVDLEGVRDRIRLLERKMEEVQFQIPQPPPPSPPATSTSATTKGKGKEKETETTADNDDPSPESKRSRARALLEDVLTRLQVVESTHQTLDDRYTDLENLVHARIQDEMEIERMGNRSWRVIEDLRDPDGVLRGIKRKREEREERMSEEEQAGSLDQEGEKRVLDKLKEQVEGIERTVLDLGGLSSRIESLESKPPPPPPPLEVAPPPPPKSPTTNTKTSTHTEADPAITILQQQVTRLTAEMEAMKEREKAMHDEIYGKLEGFIEQVSHPPSSILKVRRC
jgi:hypothetical protein